MEVLGCRVGVFRSRETLSVRRNAEKHGTLDLTVRRTEVFRCRLEVFRSRVGVFRSTLAFTVRRTEVFGPTMDVCVSRAARSPAVPGTVGGPPRQNSCRPDKSMKAAKMKDESGQTRTSIRGQGSLRRAGSSPPSGTPATAPPLRHTLSAGREAPRSPAEGLVVPP